MTRHLTALRMILVGLGMLAIMTAAGCATSGDIPLGQWSGQGVFVYEKWEKNENTGAHRVYPTQLEISKSKLDGHDVILLDILSQRGEIEGLGTQTHLRCALEEVKRPSDSMVLYRLVDTQFNPHANDKLEYKTSGPPMSASCMSYRGATILQIDYNDNFVDVYRFCGGSLEKTGTYFNTDSGMIHWTECLRKKWWP